VSARPRLNEAASWRGSVAWEPRRRGVRAILPGAVAHHRQRIGMPGTARAVGGPPCPALGLGRRWPQWRSSEGISATCCSARPTDWTAHALGASSTSSSRRPWLPRSSPSSRSGRRSWTRWWRRCTGTPPWGT
jgi:hypothetical protein